MPASASAGGVRGQAARALLVLSGSASELEPDRRSGSSWTRSTSTSRRSSRAARRRWAQPRGRSSPACFRRATATCACHRRTRPGKAAGSGIEALTERELEVLRLYAAGMTSAETAAHFVVSINTVKTQLKSIYSKLGAHSRAEAVASARKLQLIRGNDTVPRP